jgi:hypothetical protein
MAGMESCSMLQQQQHSARDAAAATPLAATSIWLVKVQCRRGFSQQFLQN